jgi:hypothetical protein
MESLEQRVARLERSLVRWRRTVLVLVCVGVVATVLGATQAREAQLDRLRVKHISVENEGGGFIELSANKMGGAGILIGGPAQRATVNIRADETEMGMSTQVTCRVSEQFAGASNTGEISASSARGGQIILEKAEQGQTKRSFEAPPPR